MCLPHWLFLRLVAHCQTGRHAAGWHSRCLAVLGAATHIRQGSQTELSHSWKAWHASQGWVLPACLGPPAIPWAAVACLASNF